MFPGPLSPRRLLGVSRATARGVAAVTGGAAGGVAGVVAAAAAVPALQAPPPVRAASTVARRVTDDVGRELSTAARALVDLHPARVRRRVWTTRGRAHIEVRGLDGSGPTHQRITREVTRRLDGLSGVRWAEVNAVTGQVLVAFDEGRVDVGTLLDTVRAVERSQGTREEDFPWNRPVHPSDPTPVAAASVELAADCVATAAAVVGSVWHLPTVPRGVRAAVTLLEVEKPLRRMLKRQVGPIGTDVVMALTSAAVTGLTHNPVAPAIDALYRFELLAEALSRQVAWRRREAQLCAMPDLLPHEAAVRVPRPRQRPKGPVETWVDQLGPATLASAAAVLGLTGRPGRAAEAILVAAPKAAKVGRDGFAAVLATRLAQHGVLAMNASAFRRLDRVGAVVLDSSVLCTPRLQVLAASAEPGGQDADVWTAALPVLRDVTVADLNDDRHPLAHGGVSLRPDRTQRDVPRGARRLMVRAGRRRLGTVTVAAELDPSAQAVVEAAVACGARVLLTDDAAVTDLRPLVDDVLDGARLSDDVRALQEDGHLVLVVSGRDDDALAAADIGVAVFGRAEGAPVCWSAHLLCGPELDGVWRVLHAVPAAREMSRRGVRLSRAGSALGTLLTVVGGRRRGRPSHALVPVHTAALVALLSATGSALLTSGAQPPPPVRHVPWHALDAVDVLAELDGTRASEDAGRFRRLPAGAVRAVAAGAEAVTGSRHVRWAFSPARSVVALTRATGEELRDPLTPVLAVGAAASAIVGSSVDALLVAAVMGGNAVISGGQRVRAEGALRSMLLEQEPSARRIPHTRSRRLASEDLAGVPHEVVRASRLRPGDVIALQAADVVPADARLLVAADLEVDESSLTGESMPVDKDVGATPAAPLAERRCMLYAGTTVVAGTAHAVVVATGDATQAGRAARAGGRASPPAGIQARLAEVTRAALPMTALGGGAVTGLAVLRGVPLRQAVAAGVSIAVAAVPEGLPLVATVAQASAARRLSRGGVLVRSSRTLEACGRVDTVCFDKTGTLTEGRLAVARVASPTSNLAMESVPAQRVLLCAARACPSPDGRGVGRLPHATDRAVLQSVEGLDGWDAVAELPFETTRGYSASVGRDARSAVLVVKGAPEIVLPLCDNGSRDPAISMAERLAAEGLRVLAVAERRDVPCQADTLATHVEGLTLLGFVGIADQPRAVAAEAVQRLRADGVRPVMVTGDHPLTARAIAKAVGMDHHAPVLTGAHLERMTEAERVRRVAETSVFARVSPEQKVQIVSALQSSGRVVAMTGDGTNDAAAIRLADVGIGVAAHGSTSARSAADVVLTDADVTRIHDLVVEGRALWHRVREAVSILVGGNAGEVAFMVAGTALAGRAPINVRQMLLVNVLTDMFPALAVAVSDSRQEDDDGTSVVAALDDGLRQAVVVRGTATAVGATSAWVIGRVTGFRRRAGTMGLAALVGTQLGQTLVTGRRSRLVVLTCLLSAAVLFAAVETPGVSQFLGCTPVGPGAWAVVLGCSAAGTLVAVLAPRVLAALERLRSPAAA